MKKQIFFFLLATAIGFAVKAQKLNGHYVLESKEMVDGKEYLNAIAKEITLTQTKDSLRIERLTPSGDGQDSKSIETLALNGKPSKITTTSKRTKTSTLVMEKGGKALTITTIYSYPEKPSEWEFKNTEIWKVGDDGSIVIEKTSDAAVTDDWTIRGMFKKG